MLCNRCVDVCPEYCLAFVPMDDVDLIDADRDAVAGRARSGDLPLTALLKDDDRCIRCGLCAIRCPTGAMTMERFQVTERWAAPPDASQDTTVTERELTAGSAL